MDNDCFIGNGHINDFTFTVSHSKKVTSIKWEMQCHDTVF